MNLTGECRKVEEQKQKPNKVKWQGERCINLAIRPKISRCDIIGEFLSRRRQWPPRVRSSA